MSKNRLGRISRLEAMAAERHRRHAAAVANASPPPSAIIAARLAEMGPFLPVASEAFDAGTAIMRSQVAEASGARRVLLIQLLNLRSAHGCADV
jgi:hypothetical protein